MAAARHPKVECRIGKLRPRENRRRSGSKGVRSRQCQGFRRNLSVPVLERALSSSAEGWELGAGGNGTRITQSLAILTFATIIILTDRCAKKVKFLQSEGFANTLHRPIRSTSISQGNQAVPRVRASLEVAWERLTSFAQRSVNYKITYCKNSGTEGAGHLSFPAGRT